MVRSQKSKSANIADNYTRARNSTADARPVVRRMSKFVGREQDISPIVATRLRGLGYRVFAEVYVGYSNSIDMVATREDLPHPVALEFKLSLTKEVLHQAARHKTRTPYVWIIVATRPRKDTEVVRKLLVNGIGVATVASGDVEVVYLPRLTRFDRPWYWNHKGINRDDIDVRRGIEDGVGGVAVAPAPAQAVYRKCVQFFAENPGASWGKAFAEVPNHYSNVQSMKRSLKTLAEYKGWSIL